MITRKNRRKRAVARLGIALSLGLAGATAEAATINVPADHPTIQDAVDAAATGDVIAVGPGTYTSSEAAVVDLLGKDLAFQSTAGAASTIIDGEGDRRCIAIGLDPLIPPGNATFDGFTIRGGRALDVDGSGGGVCMDLGDGTEVASLALSDCVVDDCASTVSGGGIHGAASAPITLTSCVVQGCSTGLRGGGVASDGAMLTITGCTFQGNSVGEVSPDNGGAAVHMNAGTTMITDTLFTANLTSQGSVYTGAGSTLTVDQCQFNGNIAHPTQRDAGIYAEAANVSVTNCAFDANEGGGLSLHSLTAFASLAAIVRNCTFENHDIIHGALVVTPFEITASWPTEATIEDCTFRNNGSPDALGGVSLTMNAQFVSDVAISVSRCTFENCPTYAGAAFSRVPQDIAVPVLFDECIFRNIASRNSWTTLYLEGDTHVKNCVFEDNTSDSTGAMYSQLGNIAIEDCAFRRNSGVSYGGAMRHLYTFPRSVTIDRCVFEDNVTPGAAHFSTGRGGAIYATTPLVIRDCAFDDNSALRYGGALFLEASGNLVERCTFRRNDGPWSGGAVYSPTSAVASIADSVFCQNTPDDVYSSWTDLGGNDFPAECPLSCAADLAGDDQIVGFVDLVLLLANWGTDGAGAGLTEPFDEVGFSDLSALLGSWGDCR